MGIFSHYYWLMEYVISCLCSFTSTFRNDFYQMPNVEKEIVSKSLKKHEKK